MWGRKVYIPWYSAMWPSDLKTPDMADLERSVGRASTPVDMGLRPIDSDESRCEALEGGLEPARGFIRAGGHSGRLLVFNSLRWAFDRAAGLQTRFFPNSLHWVVVAGRSWPQPSCRLRDARRGHAVSFPSVLCFLPNGK